MSFMKKTRISIGALAAGLMAAMLVFAGCQDGADRGTNTLVVGTIGNPVSLDPVMVNDSASAMVFQQVFNTLFDLDFDTLDVRPALAERWEFEDGGQALRVFLRRGVLFHNGDEMTANDVKFSLDRAIASPQVAVIVNMIESTTVVNSHEALIRFSAPWTPALAHLAHVATSIVSERAFREMGGDAFAQSPVGTGPMRFVSWVVGDRLELARWDQFWGPTAPTLDGIVIRVISDAATRSMELETGGIDVMYMVLPHDIARLSANPDLQIFRRLTTANNYLGFNTRDPILSDFRVRQAITYALDLNAIVQAAFVGVGQPGRAPISSLVWATAANVLPPLTQNLDRARELLAEAGYPGGGFSLVINTNEGNATRLDVATIMQGMLAQVGITLEIRSVEWGAYLDLTSRYDDPNHQMFLLGWVSVTGDPDYGLDIFHSRTFGAAGNRFFWTNPEVDRLLDEARGAPQGQTRYDMYIQAQRLIMEGRPMIPVQDQETILAARRNVSNLIINPAGEENLWAVRLD
jgi:peptide/nickel transport system substrate-binding protein